jgi:hypothetical protein
MFPRLYALSCWGCGGDSGGEKNGGHGDRILLTTVLVDDDTAADQEISAEEGAAEVLLVPLSSSPDTRLGTKNGHENGSGGGGHHHHHPKTSGKMGIVDRVLAMVGFTPGKYPTDAQEDQLEDLGSINLDDEDINDNEEIQEEEDVTP